MVKNGITKISISVKDMTQSIDFYVNELGCTVVGEQTLTDKETKAIWNVKEGITAKCVYLRKGEERPVALQLVEFSNKPSNYKRPKDKPNYTCGIFDIGFRVFDMQKSYKKMKDHIEFFNPPKPYTAPWTSNEVQEVVLWSPDRVPTAFMMSGNNTGEGFQNITTNAYFTKDVDKANDFFVKVLGLNVVFDRVMPVGLVNDILDIPEQDAPRITMIFRPGINSPVPEVLQCQHDEAECVNDYADPTDIGLISAAYEVESLTDVINKAKANGYETLAEPIEMTSALDGKVMVTTIIGPDKEMFEVYEVIK